ncbi:unnamed protein product [Amoebophrya sp. A120]|nr:unnamed protein product [Amoebophrya sp. A120]|eukprot:GSA120T00024751001.1
MRFEVAFGAALVFSYSGTQRATFISGYTESYELQLTSRLIDFGITRKSYKIHIGRPSKFFTAMDTDPEESWRERAGERCGRSRRPQLQGDRLQSRLGSQAAPWSYPFYSGATVFHAGPGAMW